MKKQSVYREYNFSDAELYLMCMERVKFAYRDREAFKSYGFDLDRLKKLKTLCDHFKNQPSDDELLGDQMICSEKKYEAANKLRSAIRGIMTRVATKYTNRSGRYRKFGTSKMGDMTDAQLLFCGRRVARVSRAQIDFLEDVGLKENHIQKVLDACRSFENSLNIQQDKVADRDISVEKRVEIGNKIYNELIVLCRIGKDIWQDKNPVFYENYTIYESNNEQKKATKKQKA